MLPTTSPYEPLDRAALLEEHIADVERLRALSADLAGDDQESLAYLRAESFDETRAHLRLLATKTWRLESNIDEVMCSESWRSSERALRSVLLYDFLGCDQHGRPLLVERVGAWNIEAILEAAVDLERFKMLHAMAVETMARVERPSDSKDSRGTVLIMDLQGLGMRHLRPALLRVFGAINEIDENFYPDSIAHIFVVNTPSIFSVLFQMIKPFLSDATLTKVHISSEVSDEMLKHVGTDCLPIELGGSRANLFPYDEAAPVSHHPEK